MQRRSWSNVTWLVVGVALALGAGCKRSPPSEAQPSPARTVEASSSRAAQEHYEDERWDDPKLAREDRLQFVWKHPDEDRASIWSMRLDGTDIRRVAKPDVLYRSGEAGELQVVSARSPDGRYIAFEADYTGPQKAESFRQSTARFLLDLKEGTVRVMQRDAGPPHFTWTPDGRAVLFYGGTALWEYDVKKGALTQRPMMYSKGLFPLDGGQRVLALRSRELAYYDRSGKEVALLALPYESGEPNAVSPDGRWLYLSVGMGGVVAPREQPDRPLFRDEVRRAFVAFGRDGKTLFYASGEEVHALEIATGRDRFLAAFQERVPADLSLVPARGAR